MDFVFVYESADFRIKIASEPETALLVDGTQKVFNGLFLVAVAGVDYGEQIVSFAGDRQLFKDVHGRGVVIHGQKGQGTVDVPIAAQQSDGLTVVSVLDGLYPGTVDSINLGSVYCVLNHVFPVKAELKFHFPENGVEVLLYIGVFRMSAQEVFSSVGRTFSAQLNDAAEVINETVGAEQSVEPFPVFWDVSFYQLEIIAVEESGDGCRALAGQSAVEPETAFRGA